MIVNIQKLRGRIVEAGLTIEKLADMIDVSKATLIRRFDNPIDFTVK